jgi:uncharacterized protein YacL
VPIKLVLRLILAGIFATFAIIFSELIPPIEGINSLLVKALITTWAGLLGFALFPDLASWFTHTAISVYNQMVSRVTSEVLTQFMRVSRNSGNSSPFASAPPAVGGISLNRPLLLDTSAIIDGRVLEIAHSGFIFGLMLIPNFILLELQQVADSADSLKRARGRRGFEIIADLKKIKSLKVEIWDKEAGGKAVDDKLLHLAKSLGGKIITTDFNLNKLAVAHGITVLNVNDLANAVKTPALPGEKIEIKVVHVGKDTTQGVGYLPDGTMVVIEDGADLIGKSIKVEVSRTIQGSAGRMIFSKVK